MRVSLDSRETIPKEGILMALLLEISLSVPFSSTDCRATKRGHMLELSFPILTDKNDEESSLSPSPWAWFMRAEPLPSTFTTTQHAFNQVPCMHGENKPDTHRLCSPSAEQGPSTAARCHSPKNSPLSDQAAGNLE